MSGIQIALTFAVDLSVLLRLGGGFQTLPTLGTAEAVLMPRLKTEKKGTFFEKRSASRLSPGVVKLLSH